MLCICMLCVWQGRFTVAIIIRWLTICDECLFVVIVNAAAIVSVLLFEVYDRVRTIVLGR